MRRGQGVITGFGFTEAALPDDQVRLDVCVHGPCIGRSRTAARLRNHLASARIAMTRTTTRLAPAAPSDERIPGFNVALTSAPRRRARRGQLEAHAEARDPWLGWAPALRAVAPASAAARL